MHIEVSLYIGTCIIVRVLILKLKGYIFKLILFTSFWQK